MARANLVDDEGERYDEEDRKMRACAWKISSRVGAVIVVVLCSRARLVAEVASKEIN